MSSMGDTRKFTGILAGHFGEDGGRLHTGVEVGCHRGGLSARLLRRFPKLVLFMVDSWCEHHKESDYAKSGDSLAKLSFDEQTTCMKAARLATDFAGSRRTILRLPSIEAAKRVPCPRLSFVILDGDHSYPAVKADIEAWWPRVEVGGILAGHDYQHPRFDGVEKAVQEFAAAAGVEINLNGSCWWCVKPQPPAVLDFGELDSVDSE
jgi:hypothetical protein